MTVTDGRVLADRYTLLGLLGSGGMADVYRATDRILEREVAIKMLRSSASGPAERARFAVEARTLAALNHPGLVTILDAGIQEKHPYLVMELIDGPTLGRRLGSVGSLDHAELQELGAQVADALTYAHDRGIVHRDVKPGNILLRKDGRVVLTDFGVAQLVGDTAEHTNAGEVIGSPAYLSPEQVNGEPLTAAVDVYALGLVLLESFTGLRAYPGPPIEAAIARLTTPPTIPVSLRRGVRDLLVEMTAMSPEERPSARETAIRLRGEDLDENAGEQGTADAGAETGPLVLASQGLAVAAITEHAPGPTSRQRRTRALMGAAAFVVVAVLALLGVTQLRPGAAPARSTPAGPASTPGATRSTGQSRTPDPPATNNAVLATTPSPGAARPTGAVQQASTRQRHPGGTRHPQGKNAKGKVKPKSKAKGKGQGKGHGKGH